MAEMVSRAFSTAMAGRPGPVVLALPHDMLTGNANLSETHFIEALETAPAPSDMAALEDMIAESRASLAGPGRWPLEREACAQITRFAESFNMPVMTSYRRSPSFHPLHPNYAGDLGLAPNPKLLARVKASDLVIVAGARLNETTSPGLHSVRHSGAADEAGACLSRRGRAGPRLSPAARHPCLAQPLCRSVGQAQTAPSRAHDDQPPRMPNISPGRRDAGATARRGQSVARS